ncbi:MAG: DUF4214 domain-containing protein [Pseudomonadota bacterium]
MGNFFSTTQKNLARSVPALALILAAGCGGGSGGGDTVAAPAPQLLATSAVSSADYTTLVQQLYVAYLGRPADPDGLANFQARLAALGAPNDIQALLAAYDTNVDIKALIDGFGNSAESETLYVGNNIQFVTAVYKNVLNRDPLLAGLDFWTSQIASGSTTKAKVALSIMAGALTNQSEQGQKDASFINKKIITANHFTTGLINIRSKNYNGADAAVKARRLLTYGSDINNLLGPEGPVTDLLSEFLPDPSVIPFDTLTGHWAASVYDESISGRAVRLDVTANSNLLTIRVTQGASETCTYSAKLNNAGNNADAGTYQCFDSSSGTWQLFDMYRIGTDDIYISLIKDGKDVRRFYGKSVVNPKIPQQVYPSLLSYSEGIYYAAFSPRESFAAQRGKGGVSPGIRIQQFTDWNNVNKIRLNIGGSNSKSMMSSNPSYAGDCAYEAIVQSDGRSLTGEKFICSSGEAGTWKLIDMSAMPGNAVQFSFVANGVQHRVYGLMYGVR